MSDPKHRREIANAICAIFLILLLWALMIAATYWATERMMHAHAGY